MADLLPLIAVHTSYIIATIIMGGLSRLLIDPEELRYLKNKIKELNEQLPPKHMRTTQKQKRKARIIERELGRVRKKYTIYNLKRLTIIFLVYGIGVMTVLYKLPFLFESPVHIPYLTFIIEEKPMIPSAYIFLMGVLLLSPIALRLGESGKPLLSK